MNGSQFPSFVSTLDMRVPPAQGLFSFRVVISDKFVTKATVHMPSGVIFSGIVDIETVSIWVWCWWGHSYMWHTCGEDTHYTVT